MSELDKEWEIFNQEFDTLKFNKIKVNNDGVEIPKCGEIYISTQTKIAFLNQVVDLNTLFWKIPIIQY